MIDALSPQELLDLLFSGDLDPEVAAELAKALLAPMLPRLYTAELVDIYTVYLDYLGARRAEDAWADASPPRCGQRSVYEKREGTLFAHGWGHGRD
jgi:hypothetical protein